jgi:hypothetical protein
MKYRIIEKANGIFIPQVKFGFGWDWNCIDKLLNNWIIEATNSKFDTFEEALEIIEKYCLWALFDEAGQKFHKAGTLFILPQKIAIKNLIPKIEKRHREGFDLTDKGCSPLRVSGETHYCIFCHQISKHSNHICTRFFPNWI